MWPHRWKSTRLPCPWDSPGKNTGVGCHFLLQCVKVKSESEVAQSCPTLSDPIDYSLPGSSVHGIFQAGVLEWGAIAFSLFRMLATPPNLVSATNIRCLFSTLSCGSLIKYLYKSFPINIFFWFPDCLGVLNWVHILILSKNYTWLSELFADLWKKKNHDLLPNRKKYRCLATAQFLQDNQNWIYSKCRRESNVLWKQKLGLNIWNFLWGLCSHFVSRLAFLLVIAKQRKITVW